MLSPLLVITIIIMEISQQAPEASPFISSPTPAWCRSSGMWGPSGGQCLSFAEAGQAGEAEGVPRSTGATCGSEQGRCQSCQPASRALKSIREGADQKNPAASQTFLSGPSAGEKAGRRPHLRPPCSAVSIKAQALTGHAGDLVKPDSLQLMSLLILAWVPFLITS